MDTASHTPEDQDPDKKDKNKKRSPDKRMDRPPFTGKDGYTQFKAGGRLYYVHRAAYERYFGPIQPGQHVHHIDGNRANNRPENLIAMSASDHARLHVQDAVRDVIGRFAEQDKKDKKKGDKNKKTDQ